VVKRVPRPFTGLFTWIKRRATDTRLSDQHVCEELRRAPTLPPPSPKGGPRLYNQHRSTQRSLTQGPLRRTEVPGAVPSLLAKRESPGVQADQPAGVVASGQVILCSLYRICISTIFVPVPPCTPPCIHIPPCTPPSTCTPIHTHIGCLRDDVCPTLALYLLLVL